MNPLLRVISSLRPTDDLAEEEEDAVDDEDAIRLRGGGGETPGDGGVVGGVLEGDVMMREVNLVGVERGDGTGV